MQKFWKTKIKTNGETRVTLDLSDFLIKQFDISAWRNLETFQTNWFIDDVKQIWLMM